MNLARIKGALGQKVKSHRFTPLERRYFAWLHLECFCCLTGYSPFEIAHTGEKAMAMKAPLWTCLPIRMELHHIEERTRPTFWKRVGFGEIIDGKPEYLHWALRLYEIFQSNQDPRALLMDMNDRANREFIRECLT